MGFSDAFVASFPNGKKVKNRKTLLSFDKIKA